MKRHYSALFAALALDRVRRWRRWQRIRRELRARPRLGERCCNPLPGFCRQQTGSGPDGGSRQRGERGAAPRAPARAATLEAGLSTHTAAVRRIDSLIDDPEVDRAAPRLIDAIAALYVPLTVRGRAVGVVAVYDKREPDPVSRTATCESRRHSPRLDRARPLRAGRTGSRPVAARRPGARANASGARAPRRDRAGIDLDRSASKTRSTPGRGGTADPDSSWSPQRSTT